MEPGDEKQLPTRIFVRVVFAGLFSLVSGMAFIASLIFRAEYLNQLFFWFVFALSGLHFVYSLRRNLGPREVKSIDYFYLATAAVGVFLLAATVVSQRSASDVERARQARTEADAQTISELSSLLSLYEEVACRQGRLVRKECSKTKNLRSAISIGPPSGVVNELQLFEQFLVSEDYTDNDTLNFRGRLIVAQAPRIKKALLQPFVPPAPRSQLLLGFDISNLSRGTGIAALWPFVLALAFAFRITKVTIEVFDWMKDQDDAESVVPNEPNTGKSSNRRGQQTEP
jgi:hypothetical protein